jgi:hypothetical protein
LYKIILEPRAKIELNQALLYYNELNINKLDFKFIVDFENALDILEKNPFFGFKHEPYRSFKLRKFPYILIFRVIEELKLVAIESIFHTSQNPTKHPK